ncbi:MAG: hypothetical protein JSS87_15380 [Acidobacteria bacterium]|nr:hypothetical protein [Acidobacteriota bacterium]
MLRLITFALALITVSAHAADTNLLTKIRSPIILKGDAHHAFRDPILARVNGKFMLIYSYVVTDPDQRVYWYTAWSTSSDFQHWTAPYIFTPKSQDLNYSSPGSLTRIGNEWVLTLQTIPMNNVRLTDPPPIHWPEEHSRLFTMRTRDFKTWSKPELIRVKGPNVAEKDMGKMIDPFLIADKDHPGHWRIFFKQNGHLFQSTSPDLKTWTFHPEPIAKGENPEVIVDHGDYLLFYSPENGTGVLRSHDGITWHEDQPPIVLGQKDWPYAETRITAGYVADMRNLPNIGKYVFVTHTMGPGKTKTNLNVLANCNIVIGWSDDLKHWHWPGEKYP